MEGLVAVERKIRPKIQERRLIVRKLVMEKEKYEWLKELRKEVGYD